MSNEETVNTNELNNTIKKLEDEAENFTSLNKAFKQIADLENRIAATKDDYVNAVDSINEINQKITKSLDNIIQESKQAYNSMEQAVDSKLEKNKSDIQIDIRNEGMQIERGFQNSLDKNFMQLEKNLTDKITEMKNTFDNKISRTNNLLMITMAISFINFIVIILLLILKK